MPLALPQLALLCVDLCLYGTLWRCLLAGVAFSEPPVGPLSGDIVIPEPPGVVDGMSSPLPPACDFASKRSLSRTSSLDNLNDSVDLS